VNGAESSMPVIQPYLKPPVRKDLLHDEVGQTILIHVQRRNGECGLIRLECQFGILAGSDVEPDAKQLTALKLTRIHENGPIGPAVVVKVCRDEFQPEGIA
jgi:hypothetical protein